MEPLAAQESLHAESYCSRKHPFRGDVDNPTGSRSQAVPDRGMRDWCRQPMMGVDGVEHEVARRHRHHWHGKVTDHHVYPAKGARHTFPRKKHPPEGMQGRVTRPGALLHAAPLSFAACSVL